MKTRVDGQQAADAHAGADHSDGGDPHVLPLSLYYGIFAVLIFLTVVTVGVSQLGLPPTLSIIVAMAVACVKALLVVLYFMHLKYDVRFHGLIFAATLFFIGLFMVIIISDLAYRDLFVPEHANFLLDKYEGQKTPPAAAAPAPAP